MIVDESLAIVALLWKSYSMGGRTGARELVAEAWQPFSAGLVLPVLETFLTAAAERHFHLSVLAFLPPGAQFGQQECLAHTYGLCCFPKESAAL